MAELVVGLLSLCMLYVGWQWANGLAVPGQRDVNRSLVYWNLLNAVRRRPQQDDLTPTQIRTQGRLYMRLGVLGLLIDCLWLLVMRVPTIVRSIVATPGGLGGAILSIGFIVVIVLLGLKAINARTR